MSELSLTYIIAIPILDIVKQDKEELRARVMIELDMAKHSLLDSIACYKEGECGKKGVSSG